MVIAKSNPSLTRDAILDAAIRLFQQSGFSGIGMRQIAERLQIKAPSLYHHFTSKEELARQALQQYRAKQVPELRKIDALEGLSPKLLAYAKLYSDMLEDQSRPCMYLVMVREPSLSEESCKEELLLFAKQNVDWLENVLRTERAESNSQERMPERELATIIFASLEGMMAVSLVCPEPSKSFRQMAKGFLQTIVGGP